MKNTLTDNILNICKVLSNHAVEYMIVGGAAVALHGYFRPSLDDAGSFTDKPDLDFWYNPAYANYFNLLNAFEELKLDVEEFKNETAPNPKKSFFKFECENFTLDFLPELKGLTRFSTSFKNKEAVSLQGTEIWFIGYDDLIKDKAENARPKDLIDIEHLKNKRSEQK
ncbi:MAG TPA: hypothetical protein VGN20_00620 [Mucilaginibacter sp.]|jgi:predicted nucleotidyltransferase